MGPINLFALCLALPPLSDAVLSNVHVETRQSDVALLGCASQCLTTLLPSSRCQSTDTSCLCTDANFLAASATCVQANCTVKETLKATRIQTTVLCPQPIRNESAETKAIIWAIYGVAAVSVIARLISRLSAVGGSGFGWDDWTILLALALLTPLDAICYLMADHGLGQDIWMLEPDAITRILYYFWIDEYLYTLVINLTKISILLVYLRMFADADSGKFRRACYILIGILAVYAVVMNVVLAAGCQPVSYAWNQWDGEHEGRCISYQGQIYSTAALNILFDLLVFLFPIPKLVKLAFSSTRKKVALCLTFLVGLFVTICSVIRLQYLTAWGNSTNLSWGYTPIAIWSNIECNGSVLCACMPSLAGLMQRLWARLSGTPISSYGRGSVIRDDDRPGDYELRLRSTSMSRPSDKHEGRSKYPNSLGMNPRDSFKPQMTSFESDYSLEIPVPSPDSHQQQHIEQQDQDNIRSWHATKPLPKLSADSSEVSTC